MSALRDDLKATAESIALDAERLADVEHEKSDRAADDPAVPGLAQEAEELTETIGRKVAAERDLLERMDNGPRGA